MRIEWLDDDFNSAAIEWRGRAATVAFIYRYSGWESKYTWCFKETRNLLPLRIRLQLWLARQKALGARARAKRASERLKEWTELPSARLLR